MWVNAKYMDLTMVVSCLRYYAGWADKIQGKTIEVGASACRQAHFLTRDRLMRTNWLIRDMNHMALW